MTGIRALRAVKLLFTTVLLTASTLLFAGPQANAGEAVPGVNAAVEQYIVLKVAHTGMCLDVAHGSRAHAAPVVQAHCRESANQLWKFVKMPSEADWYQLQAKHSGMCLDVAHRSMAHGARVVQAQCGSLFDRPYNQYWRVVPGTSLIQARHSGMCLDVAHRSRAHAAPVVQATCVGGTNQQWALGTRFL